MFNIPLGLGNNLRGQNNCHSTVTFHRSIAGMTSQIGHVQLISSRDYLDWLMNWEGLKDRMEKVRTSFKITAL